MSYPCGATKGHICLGAGTSTRGNKECDNAADINAARVKGADGRYLFSTVDDEVNRRILGGKGSANKSAAHIAKLLGKTKEWVKEEVARLRAIVKEEIKAKEQSGTAGKGVLHMGTHSHFKGEFGSGHQFNDNSLSSILRIVALEKELKVPPSASERIKAFKSILHYGLGWTLAQWNEVDVEARRRFIMAGGCPPAPKPPKAVKEYDDSFIKPRRKMPEGTIIRQPSERQRKVAEFLEADLQKRCDEYAVSIGVTSMVWDNAGYPDRQLWFGTILLGASEFKSPKGVPKDEQIERIKELRARFGLDSAKVFRVFDNFKGWLDRRLAQAVSA